MARRSRYTRWSATRSTRTSTATRWQQRGGRENVPRADHNARPVDPERDLAACAAVPADVHGTAFAQEGYRGHDHALPPCLRVGADHPTAGRGEGARLPVGHALRG